MKFKKNIFHILATLVLICISPVIMGQQTTRVQSSDTLQPADVTVSADYLDRLDSLYAAWLGDRLPVRVYQDTAIAFSKDHPAPPDLPDSVYRSRLAAIPSAIELTYNQQVRSYLDLYTKSRRKQVSIMLGLADYYFPMIEAKLDAWGLPLELKYLPIIESALNPIARSRVGAQGMWQFMLGTARLYHLTVNSFIDERLDPVKSTEVACAYLKELYSIFGDWHMVIAAYNCGPGNMKKAIQRAGGKKNYWDVYYYLPKETRGFVPAFIAATYIMNFAQDHGFAAVKPIIPIVTDTVMVSNEIHLSQISDVLGIDLTTLQLLNPKYKRKILPEGGGPYDLRLPEEDITPFITMEDSILNYKRDVYLAKNNLDKKPVRSTRSSGKAKPQSGDEVTLSYTIKSGDNLGFIAAWYDVAVTDLKDWNGLYGNSLKAGGKLTVYVPKTKADRYKDINSLSFDEKQARLSGNSVPEPSASPATESYAQLKDKYVLYTVRSGDNLWSIAQKYPGTSHEDIMKLNQMSGSKLQTGQVLKIKRKEG